MACRFIIALRGYDMAEVDHLLSQADEALLSGQEILRAAAPEALQGAQPRRRFRGYARHEVDRALRRLLNELSDDS